MQNMQKHPWPAVHDLFADLHTNFRPNESSILPALLAQALAASEQRHFVGVHALRSHGAVQRSGDGLDLAPSRVGHGGGEHDESERDGQRKDGGDH